MEQRCGHMRLQGSVAYVPQQPWILTGTFRYCPGAQLMGGTGGTLLSSMCQTSDVSCESRHSSKPALCAIMTAMLSSTVNVQSSVFGCHSVLQGIFQEIFHVKHLREHALSNVLKAISAILHHPLHCCNLLKHCTVSPFIN